MHFSGAAHAFLQALCNIGVAVGYVMDTHAAAEHLSINRVSLTQVVYWCNVLGIMFYFAQCIADIFLQAHVYKYLLIKIGVGSFCLIIGLVILAILRKKLSNGKSDRFKRMFLWCSLIISLGASYGVGILLSQNILQVCLIEKILLVSSGIIHVLGTLVNNELSYISST